MFAFSLQLRSKEGVVVPLLAHQWILLDREAHLSFASCISPRDLFGAPLCRQFPGLGSFCAQSAPSTSMKRPKPAGQSGIRSTSGVDPCPWGTVGPQATAERRRRSRRRPEAHGRLRASEVMPRESHCGLRLQVGRKVPLRSFGGSPGI